ncbi:MAG: NUDIX hydrolase [Candidatus Levyibacteriota bacterium]
MPESLGYIPEREIPFQNPFFTILARGPFTPDAVIVNRSAAKVPSPDVSARIWTEWDANRLESRNVRRTLAIRSHPAVSNGTLTLDVEPRAFTEFDGISNPNGNYDRRYANPIGTSIVIATLDGKLLLSRRPEDDPIRPGGVMHVIGGFPEIHQDELKPDVTLDVDTNGRWLPFSTIQREVFEETGIQPDKLTDLALLGVSYNPLTHQPILAFSGQTTLTSSEINSQPSERIPKRYIDFSEQSITDLLLKFPFSPSPTAQANLFLFGGESFGDSWLRKIDDELCLSAITHKNLSPEERHRHREKGIEHFLANSSS